MWMQRWRSLHTKELQFNKGIVVNTLVERIECRKYQEVIMSTKTNKCRVLRLCKPRFTSEAYTLTLARAMLHKHCAAVAPMRNLETVTNLLHNCTYLTNEEIVGKVETNVPEHRNLTKPNKTSRAIALQSTCTVRSPSPQSVPSATGRPFTHVSNGGCSPCPPCYRLGWHLHL